MDCLSEHIRHIYICLALSTLVSVISVLSTAIIITNVQHITIISTVGCAGFSLLVLLLSDKSSTTIDWKICILLGFAGFSGIGATELFKDTLKEKPSILLSTLVDATQVFICLSACAFLSDKDRWIVIGMPLMCILLTVLVISYANIYDKSYNVSRALIYLSLFSICGLVVYDTQMVIKKFENGDKNYIRRGMTMFTDFVGIYRRLLILAVDKLKQENQLEVSIQRDEQNLHLSGTVPLMVPINALS